MTDVRVILVTAPDPERAAALARAVVDARLAACVNIVSGVRSLYRWKGELCDDQEVLLIIKSTRDRVRELTDRITELHPYDVPEVLALEVVAGADAYLEWVRAETALSEE